ncbi:MAG: hypothetical protein IKL82_01010 [Clostridia bacterium]|nr:hypothetical protein [Clostridia bacterium]
MYKRAKIFFIIFIIIFINFLTLDFLLIDVEKTALIVALGVDKIDEGYEVTVQIAVPEATNQSTKSNESVIYAKGETLYQAVNRIGKETGWYPKLSFCNLIILGSSVFEDNVMSVVDFFIRSYKVEDSAILCASEESAKSVLNSISPLDNISSFALSKIFVRDYNTASPILTTSVKEFSENYYSNASYGYMPLIKMIETEDNGNNTSQASSVGTQSGKGGDDGKSTPVVYDATSAVIFSGGNMVGKVSGDECLFFSLLDKPANEDYFSLNVTKSNENGLALISVRKSKNKVNLTLENGTPVLNAELKVWLKVDDGNFPESMKEIATLGKLSEKTLKDASKYIEETLKTFFSYVKSVNADVFGIKNMLYRYHYKEYEKLSENVFQNTEFKIKVTSYNYI